MCKGVNISKVKSYYEIQHGIRYHEGITFLSHLLLEIFSVSQFLTTYKYYNMYTESTVIYSMVLRQFVPKTNDNMAQHYEQDLKWPYR